MKRTVMTTLIGLAVAATVLAGGFGQKDSMPTVDQILDKYVQAIGGKAAVEKQTSLTAKGAFEIPAMGMSGNAEEYAKAPNKMLFIVDIAGHGVVQQGYNGAVAWSSEPAQGLREESGAELASTKIESEFHKETKIRQLFSKIEFKGKEKVGEKDAYVLLATPTGSSAQKLYFDIQSGLLIRTDVEQDTPQGKVPVEKYLDDYKDVDGVKIPFTRRHVLPQMTFVIKLTDVKHNVAIDDAKFNKPAGQ